MTSVAAFRFSGTLNQPSNQTAADSSGQKRSVEPAATNRAAMYGNHYLYLGSPWLLNDLFPEMEKNEFRRELSRLQPFNMNLIAHELGHLVTSHVAGNTCTQLSLIPGASNHYKSDAYVDFLNPPGNLQETLKEMVIRSAGLAGSLQVLFAKEKENPEVCQQLLTNASQDVEDMYELLKEAGDQGWLDSEAMQLPLIDFDTQMQVKDKMLALKNKAGGITPEYRQKTQTLYEHSAKQLARFFSFPMFQDALETAQQMIASIPLDNQLKMFKYVSKKDQLNQRQIQKMLDTTLGQPERDDMNAHLDSFVRKYSKKDGKALYEKGKPFKSTEQWNAILSQTTSLYGTF